jgi:N-acetylneuraminic acid mutarotase
MSAWKILVFVSATIGVFASDPADECIPWEKTSPGEPHEGRSITITWTNASPLPVSSCRFASGLIDGKIYVFGGQALLDSAELVHFVYDIEGDTWADTLAPIPNSSSNSKGVVYNGKLYVLGGYNPNNADLRCYDPSTNTWETLSSPPGYSTIYKYGAAVSLDRIYYFYGRWDDENESTIGFSYDPAGDEWEQIEGAPAPGRTYLCSGGWDGLAYALGGRSDTLVLGLLEELDAVSGSWSSLLVDSLPAAGLVFGDGDFLFDHFFIAGGGGGYGDWPALDDVRYWSADSGWVETNNLPEPVGIPGVELYVDSLDTLIFVIGGYNGSYLNTVYKGTISGLVGDVVEHSGSSVDRDFRVVGNTLSRGGFTLEYGVREGESIELGVFDGSGRLVRRLLDGLQTEGLHRWTWDGRSGSGTPVSSGVYLCLLRTQGRIQTLRVLLLR